MRDWLDFVLIPYIKGDLLMDCVFYLIILVAVLGFFGLIIQGFFGRPYY